MARFRNTRTGVIVDVDDGTASTLGAGYEPAEKKAPQRKRAASEKSDEK